jgi:hypothetical protein
MAMRVLFSLRFSCGFAQANDTTERRQIRTSHKDHLIDEKSVFNLIEILPLHSQQDRVNLRVSQIYRSPDMHEHHR